MLYWDANSTSKLRPCAFESVSTILSENRHLNPSSIHQEGRRARSLLRDARENILSYLFPNDSENSRHARLVFVSGGTEGCNSLVRGFLKEVDAASLNIVSSAIEHAAILEPIKNFKDRGANVNLVSACPDGVINLEKFASAILPQTDLVSLMLGNNETGRGQSVIEVAQFVQSKAPNAVLISDVTQGVSKVPLDLGELFKAGVSAVVLSAHKIGGLPGIGAIIFNTNSTCRFFNPLILGGGQEDKLRGGTEFVMGAVAFGEVCKYLRAKGEAELVERLALKKLLLKKLHDIPQIQVQFVGHENKFDLVNTVYLRAKGIRADDLVVALDIEGLLCSTGSACSSGRQDVSHVPLALGFNKSEAREFFRISLDWDATLSDIENGIQILSRVLARYLNNEGAINGA